MPNPAAYLRLGACVGRQPSCKLFASSTALTVHTTGTPAAVTAGLGQTLHENTDGGGGGVAILIARLEIRNPDDGPTMVQHNDGATALMGVSLHHWRHPGPLHLDEKVRQSFLYVETCIGRFTGTGGTVASKTWLAVDINSPLRALTALITSISPVICRKRNGPSSPRLPGPAAPGAAWYAISHQSSNDSTDQAVPGGRPCVLSRCPGPDLDMASNDDMLLSAFDLTKLPITGKSMEHSPAEAPGRHKHQH
ncbi:hypothetical protein CMUS01_02100 [Colletotrichum musicola]|uniref:Uncharacterized protein n=1 Tax=Colletotrichum musicola TaxID=2175873 RepID=A0A8H6NVV6_9PEZI|nr:hypothetical protein CMUS01_02100 [Colletotrichum musicola]